MFVSPLSKVPEIREIAKSCSVCSLENSKNLLGNNVGRIYSWHFSTRLKFSSAEVLKYYATAAGDENKMALMFSIFADLEKNMLIIF